MEMLEIPCFALISVEKLLQNHVKGPEMEHGIKLIENTVKPNPWYRQMFKC